MNAWTEPKDLRGTAAAHRFVIAAGGTGGHIFPAEAVARVLAARGHEVSVLTDARAAARAHAFEGFDTAVLAGAGLAGRGVWRAAAGGAAVLRGAVAARARLARTRCDVVVAFGGYPSVAPVLAARTLRRRPAVLLHEQNAVLGRANRVLASLADALALSFARTRHAPVGARLEVTGNPVRDGFAAVPPWAPAAELRLLVVGGSLGARVLGAVVPEAVAALAPALRARLRIVQQVRDEDLDAVRARYAGIGIEATLAPFLADMPERLAAADLVIARAGASTVAELAVAGRAAILVPLPGAIDDHQMANAQALQEAGAARLMAQPGFTAPALASLLAELLAAPERLAAMAAAAREAARPEAAERVADLAERLAAARGRA